MLHAVLLRHEAPPYGRAEEGPGHAPHAGRERDPTPPHPAVPDFVQVSG